VKKSPQDDNDAFLFILGAILLTIAAAFGFSFALKTPLPAQISFDGAAIAWGIIATVPLAVLLLWFTRTTNPMLASFRNDQIEFFAKIGFEFTPLRITLMAIGAGVSEELLFRGVFQTWIDGFAPVIVALIITNIVFGLLHYRTAIYAIIAGVVGIYLGTLYVLTGNLIAPIIAHGLYDAIAFAYLRRAIIDWRAQQPR